MSKDEEGAIAVKVRVRTDNTVCLPSEVIKKLEIVPGVNVVFHIDKSPLVGLGKE